MTVEISAAETASTSVLRTAPSVSESRNSSRYQWKEKPEKTERLFDSLKEKTSRIAMGAKIGGSDGKADGEVGPATWNDLLGLKKI